MTEHYARILLLSHMRACTSLAGHILGSHPAINGYFEMHFGYEDAAALDRQLEVLLEYETLKENSRYLFDKLLHNDYRLVPEALGPVDIRILVSLMAPEQTIKSIVNLFAKKGAGARYADPAAAAGYYIERLEWLARFCRSVSRPYYYYDAELFREDTAALLGRLGEWLDLESPLSERYRVFSQTGRARMGDTSQLIRSGTIVKTRTDHAHVRIPVDVLDRARAVYRECRATLIAHAADALVRQDDRGVSS